MIPKMINSNLRGGHPEMIQLTHIQAVTAAPWVSLNCRGSLVKGAMDKVLNFHSVGPAGRPENRSQQFLDIFSPLGLR